MNNGGNRVNIVWMAAGAYLVLLAIRLVKILWKDPGDIKLYIFVVLFAAVGIGLIVVGTKRSKAFDADQELLEEKESDDDENSVDESDDVESSDDESSVDESSDAESNTDIGNEVESNTDESGSDKQE